MKLLTFKGGVRPPENKLETCNIPIKNIAPSKIMTFLMSQANDNFCEPCVSVGSDVLMGQLIGEAIDDNSVPIHSSVSGKVIAIEERMHPNGEMVKAVVIENNGFDTPAQAISANKDYRGLSSDEIVDVVRKAGIVGMGGEGYPTHLKLSQSQNGKKIDKIIINAAETEPYLTCDHRTILEKPYELIGGLKVILHNFGLNKAYIAIEENKPDAINLLTQLAKREKDIKINVVVLKSKYPQGGEAQIISAVLKHKIQPGKLPADMGIAVFNVGTCCEIYRSLMFGTPLLGRVVTIAGDCVKNPVNVRVRIGTSFEHIFESIGGFLKEPERVIMGGPMTGIAVSALDIPVIKTTTGLLALNKAKFAEEMPCINCGKCVISCPSKLAPAELNTQARNEKYDNLKALNAFDCIECGTCSYLCPSNQHQTKHVRLAKLAAE